MKWGDTLKMISQHPSVVANREKLQELFEATRKDPKLMLRVTSEGWSLSRKKILSEPEVVDMGFWSSQGEALSDMYFGTVWPGNIGPVKDGSAATH